MKAPSLFENIDHWFAIQREKARQEKVGERGGEV